MAHKKIWLAAIILSLFAAQLPALDFSLGVGVTDLYNAPEVGMELGFQHFDIMFAAGFAYETIENTSENPTTPDREEPSWLTRFYLGVAPKVTLTDSLVLSFPLLGNVSFGKKDNANQRATQGTSISAHDIEYLNYGLEGGVRLTFRFNDNWSIYAGGMFLIFQINTTTSLGYERASGTPTTVHGETKTESNFFDSTRIPFGIRYTF